MNSIVGEENNINKNYENKDWFIKPILGSQGNGITITSLPTKNDTKNCIVKIQYISGDCFSIPRKIIVIKDKAKAKKIIPIISDNPATA